MSSDPYTGYVTYNLKLDSGSLDGQENQPHYDSP